MTTDGGVNQWGLEKSDQLKFTLKNSHDSTVQKYLNLNGFPPSGLEFFSRSCRLSTIFINAYAHLSGNIFQCFIFNILEPNYDTEDFFVNYVRFIRK